MKGSKQTSSGLLIALSAGGSKEELAVDGIGEEHVEELMVRLAMKLLSDGHRLAFGGTLGIAGRPLTQFLIDTAQKWLDEESASKVDVTKPETWPLVNYSAWPNYVNIGEEQRAKLVGICQFVDIDPPGVARADLAAATDPALINRYAADAMSAMRERSALETDLRIVWGGRIQGAKGWMAGILEEVAYSLEHHKPILVLGGFGGCARLLADFLRDQDATWPDQLSLAASADAARDALLTEMETERLSARLARAKELLTEYRAAIYSEDSVHGVASELVQQALESDTSRIVIGLAATAALELATG